MKKELINTDQLYNSVASILEAARLNVASVVNLKMVHTYFEIGKIIVENEQNGQVRAIYGKHVLKDLSIRLTKRFGKGFSEQNLRNMRQFFLVYENRIATIRQKPSGELYNFRLSWSHYMVLMRIQNQEERTFYEIEAIQENWSEPHLKRQYHSSLYERLALSRNKEDVMKLSNIGNVIVKSTDILKNPLTLEFLGMEEKAIYSESDLENAIISKIQLFLLELGKGFLFEARQKRFSFDEKHYFVDLVF